ncbi:MAG: glycosyltransferase [Deltaproteobacteria bacterium]|nr:glycosyltransferase [Deltaproteobacteria bacterium]MBI3017638.1 glycosyltransferase [Deltaproteobacteria bacterium]
MLNDLVSVIIPTFNHAQYITKAIDSILKQNYENIEIIIVDDASTDNTSQLIQSLPNPRLRYIKHEANQGISHARNTGLSHANGNFIAFLDSDDWWLPHKLHKQVTIAEEYPEADFICSNGYFKDKNHLLFTTKTKSGIIPFQSNHWPLKGISPTPSSWFFRKKILAKVSSFDTNLKRCEDGDFFVRVAKHYKIYFINEPLVFWLSPNDLTATLEQIKTQEIFLNKHKEDMRLDREYYCIYTKTLGKDYLRLGFKKEARNYLLEAFKTSPFQSAIWSKLLKTFL